MILERTTRNIVTFSRNRHHLGFSFSTPSDKIQYLMLIQARRSFQIRVKTQLLENGISSWIELLILPGKINVAKRQLVWHELRTIWKVFGLLFPHIHSHKLSHPRICKALSHREDKGFMKMWGNSSCIKARKGVEVIIQHVIRKSRKW